MDLKTIAMTENSYLRASFIFLVLVLFLKIMAPINIQFLLSVALHLALTSAVRIIMKQVQSNK